MMKIIGVSGSFSLAGVSIIKVIPDASRFCPGAIVHEGN
jgi:hypothetical protein